MVFVVRAVSLNLANPEKDAPITVQLTDFRESGSVNRSIGAARGPGGPRELPKLGTPIPPAPSTGKLDTGSIESAVPSPSVESPPAAPKPIPLPGPKVLAANPRSEYVNANETAPDSLVRLPTKAAPTTLPGSAATDTAMNQSSQAAIKGGVEGPGIKALNEGAQIPGALKGTGTGLGPYGVPGGSRSGTGFGRRWNWHGIRRWERRWTERHTERPTLIITSISSRNGSNRSGSFPTVSRGCKESPWSLLWIGAVD